MKTFLLFVFTTNIILAQQVCETPEKELAELHVITKCAVEDSKNHIAKNTRDVPLKANTKSIRFLKRRELLKTTTNLKTTAKKKK